MVSLLQVQTWLKQTPRDFGEHITFLEMKRCQQAGDNLTPSILEVKGVTG